MKRMPNAMAPRQRNGTEMYSQQGDTQPKPNVGQLMLRIRRSNRPLLLSTLKKCVIMRKRTDF